MVAVGLGDDEEAVLILEPMTVHVHQRRVANQSRAHACCTTDHIRLVDGVGISGYHRQGHLDLTHGLVRLAADAGDLRLLCLPDKGLVHLIGAVDVCQEVTKPLRRRPPTV